MVFYRKYRPQKIEELDSEHVREVLTSALSAKEVSHAFLFTGPKGLGKTSAARIVAKVVNCEKNSKVKSQKSKLQVKIQKLESIEPCNACEMCVSITNGTNLDVLEIDAASNRGIDEIRDLREKARLAPVLAKKKVYIIDEVHMLTTEAFNALLKTLEEPPAHVMFILCTTESQKVPATILSRCFHIAFSSATKEELLRSFKRIIDGEKIAIDEDATESLVAFSDGGFRDGAKMLEEISLLAKGEKITKELIEKKYKIVNSGHFVNLLLQHLSSKKTKEALEVIGEITSSGIDIPYIVEQLINALHALLLFQFKVIPSPGITSSFSVEEIKELIQLLAKAHAETKYAVLPQLPLELAVVEYTAGGAGRISDVATGARQAKENAQNISPSSLSESRLPTKSEAQNDIQKPTFNSVASRHAPISKNNIWPEFIEKVKQENFSAAGLLRGCHLAELDEKKMIIETKYKFHKEKLDEHKTLELLEKITAQLTGNDVAVSIVLKE